MAPRSFSRRRVTRLVVVTAAAILVVVGLLKAHASIHHGSPPATAIASANSRRIVYLAQGAGGEGRTTTAVLVAVYRHKLELPVQDNNNVFDETRGTESFISGFMPTDVFDAECQPVAAWQSEQHPVCNELHAVSFVDNMVAQTGSLLAGKGTWRGAWEIQDAAVHTTAKMAWKFLRLGYFDEKQTKNTAAELFEQNRIDVLVMERLTSSASVVSAYAFCGTSIVAEFAARDLISAVSSNPAPEQRLRWGISIAKGLADIHALESVPSICYNDCKPKNIVLDSNDRPMLNDFNLAVMLRKDNTTGHSCPSKRPYRVKMACLAPEEFLDDKDLATGTGPVLVWKDKIDVYALGNICYFLATGHQPWQLNTEFHEAMRQLKMMNVSSMPLIGSNETQHPAIERLLNATRACFTFYPLQRPSAKDVVHMLQQPFR